MTSVTGEFDVKLTPQAADDADAFPGRMLVDKQYHGDLEATGKGQMLAAMTDTPGSAGYVALEKITGKLGGKTGSFMLQHFGLMDRNTPQLTVTVVPDSGTGELTGLSGKMAIRIEGKKHFYDFEYAIEVKP